MRSSPGVVQQRKAQEEGAQSPAYLRAAFHRRAAAVAGAAGGHVASRLCVLSVDRFGVGLPTAVDCSPAAEAEEMGAGTWRRQRAVWTAVAPRWRRPLQSVFPYSRRRSRPLELARTSMASRPEQAGGGGCHQPGAKARIELALKLPCLRYKVGIRDRAATDGGVEWAPEELS
jgi:hypothetical protein